MTEQIMAQKRSQKLGASTEKILSKIGKKVEGAPRQAELTQDVRKATELTQKGVRKAEKKTHIERCEKSNRENLGKKKGVQAYSIPGERPVNTVKWKELTTKLVKKTTVDEKGRHQQEISRK